MVRNRKGKYYTIKLCIIVVTSVSWGKVHCIQASSWSSVLLEVTTGLLLIKKYSVVLEQNGHFSTYHLQVRNTQDYYFHIEYNTWYVLSQHCHSRSVLYFWMDLQNSSDSRPEQSDWSFGMYEVIDAMILQNYIDSYLIQHKYGSVHSVMLMCSNSCLMVSFLRFTKWAQQQLQHWY